MVGVYADPNKNIPRNQYSLATMTDWTQWKVLANVPKKNKKEIKAPTALFALPNPDKLQHESYKDYSPDENPARFPGPFRCCVIGRVNSGKSLIAKHILIASSPQAPISRGVRRARNEHNRRVRRH